MAKKWMPAIIIVICMIFIAGAAYWFRPYETEVPRQNNTLLPGDAGEPTSEGEVAWANKEVIAVEWDGKRTSWMLKHTEGGGDSESDVWTLNGSPVSSEQAHGILSEMNALLIQGLESSRKASSLKAEVMDSTVTIVSGPEHGDKVYQIAVEPAYPETAWIIPTGETQVYPIPIKSLMELEKKVDSIKAAAGGRN